MSQFEDQTPNPYAATSTLETSNTMMPQRAYGGFGRLAYFGLTFAAGMVYNIMLVVIAAAAGEAGAWMFIPMVLVYFIALFWIVAQRMINCGYSGWWCVGIIVPILNILVALRCIACPEGYADHGTLDTAGKVITGIMLGFIVLGVVFIVFAVVGGVQ